MKPSSSRRKRMSFVDSIIFQASPYSEAYWPRLGPDVEDVFIQSTDNLKINAWFTTPKHPHAVVLFAHGNGGNLAHREYLLSLFRDKLNCAILLFDYRGYGRSDGIPSETGVLDDARAARRWLAKRTGVTEKEIVLIGESLGGGVVVDLAAKDGARGLVLESTFTSLPDVAASKFRVLPVRLLVRTKLDSFSKIGDYHGPLLQSHGDADQLIPFAQAEKLFKAANSPKQFVRNPGGGHNDPPTQEYLNALKQFLANLPTSDAGTMKRPSPR